LFGININKWLSFRFEYLNNSKNQVDTIFLCLGVGDNAHYPSVIPRRFGVAWDSSKITQFEKYASINTDYHLPTNATSESVTVLHMYVGNKIYSDCDVVKKISIKLLITIENTNNMVYDLTCLDKLSINGFILTNGKNSQIECNHLI